MKDIIRTTAITSAMFLTAISPIASNAKGMETPITSAGTVSVATDLWDTYDGSVGTLAIGGYSAQLYSGTSQGIVDAWNSAAYMNWPNGMIAIADHAGQGFDAINYNGTATITDNSTITYLTCVARYDGYNTGNGINLNDGTYAENLGYPYCMYTCKDAAGYWVSITYWVVSGVGAVAPQPVYQAPVQETYVAPAAEPVQQTYEAPAEQTYQEAAPAETQQVVDTTATDPTQQATNETAEVKQTASDSATADQANEAAPAYLMNKTEDSNNSSETAETESVSFEEVFSEVLTANEQDVSDPENALLPEYGREAYYADNRRWLALAASQDESFILA